MNLIELKYSTAGHNEVINLTPDLEKAVRESKIKDGLVLIFVSGSTAAITTLEYEPNLIQDFKNILEKLIPEKSNYLHNQTWSDNNGYAHLRASLIGQSLTVPIERGKLVLGTWQQIILVDFDNRPREREVIIKITSG